MIQQTLSRIRQSLATNKGEIDHIAAKSGVSRRTLYYVIEGKALTVETMLKLEKYFDDDARRSNGSPAKLSKPVRLGQGSRAPKNRGANGAKQ